MQDDVIDQALQVIKSNPDPAARKTAAETINKRFGEQVYNWWWSWTLWGVATQPYVNGIERNIAARWHEGDRSGVRRPPPGQPDLVRQRQVRVIDSRP